MKNFKFKKISSKLVSILCAVAIIASMAVLAGCSGETSTTSGTKTESTTVAETTVPQETIEVPDNAINVAIDVKDYGTISVALFPDVAPITVENFVNLVNKGFYDGLTFHRIMEGFMIQGGDPLGNGTGGSDEEIKGEFSSNGVENNLSHLRGVISMARSMDMDSASSQFFIVHEDSTFLDGQYAAFGYVTDGMSVVDAICKDAQPTDSNGTILADEQPVINSIKVVD